jgi:ABC-2 type transport system ATP-binding protein
MKVPAIKINYLSYNYKEQENLFTNLNLIVEAGDRFGLFGPNGAGKTTLISLLTGLLSFKEGSIELFNNSIHTSNQNIKKLFGFVPQDFSFYEELTPSENLEFFGAWYGLNQQQIQRKANELFEILNLTSVQNKQVKKFSGGMKRKVNLAIGVMHNPQLLFLDEPTVGVDVEARHEIINYLKRLNANGTTLVYTSHQLNEAEQLCNKIALIDEGKIIAFDTLNHLLAEYRQHDLESLFVHLTGKAYKD